MAKFFRDELCRSPRQVEADCIIELSRTQAVRAARDIVLSDVLLDSRLIDLELLDELVDRNSRRVTGHKFCNLGFI